MSLCKQALLFQKLTLLLAAATLISAFGSSFQYGYNVAVINSPAPVLALSLHIYYLCVLVFVIHCNPMHANGLSGHAAVLQKCVRESQ